MVNKLMRQKSRNCFFIFSIVLTLFLLMLATPAVFNYEEYFKIGYFRFDKDYRIDYSDGYGEVNMDFQLEHSREDRYSYYLSCYFSTGEDVEIVGITGLNFTISVMGSIVSHRVINFDPPIEQYTRAATVLVKKSDPIIWSGSAEVKFISNSIVQNETIEFLLGITILMGNQDYSYVSLTSYIVFFFWIFAFLVIPLTLKFIIQPHFGAPFDAEEMKKQKEYFDYFKKSQEE